MLLFQHLNVPLCESCIRSHLALEDMLLIEQYRYSFIFIDPSMHALLVARLRICSSTGAVPILGGVSPPPWLTSPVVINTSSIGHSTAARA